MNWPNPMTQPELSESVKTYQAQSHSKTCWTIISKPLELTYQKIAILEWKMVLLENLNYIPTQVYLLDSANDVPTSWINKILSGLSKSNESIKMY